MFESVLSQIKQAQKDHKQLLAILIDPDKISLEEIPSKMQQIHKLAADFILVGGSLLFHNVLDQLLQEIKKHTTLPLVLFPGSALQVSPYADAMLFIQLISGRNPDYLIGNQVMAAPLLKQTQLEVIPTGYILVESGRETTVSYISNSKPIPAHKPEIAMATALAGQYLGHQLIYMDGGSGGLHPIPDTFIEYVQKHIDLPLIIGGGIKNRFQLDAAYEAGATLVVIGTAFEQNSFDSQ